jgi:phosphatidylserine synthase
MRVETQSNRWLGWGVAAIIFAYLWSAGGYWHYVVAILVAVSAVVILADMNANRKH